MGDVALAVQFHPEVTDAIHESWIADTAEQLANVGIDEDEWRAQRDLYNPPMQDASAAMLSEWLVSVENR